MCIFLLISIIIKIPTYLVTSILSPPFQGGNKAHPGKELVVKSITKSQAGHYVCKVNLMILI